MEVISPSSEVRNRKDKREIYERIGIREYFLFQPDATRPGPRLVGYELGQWGYRRLGPEVGLPGSVRSALLGVSLRPEGAFLRVRDARSGTDYLWHEEMIDANEAAETARRLAEQAAEREAAGRRAEAAARRAAEQKGRAGSGSAKGNRGATGRN